MFSIRRFFSGEKPSAQGRAATCTVRALAARDLGAVLRIEAESHPNAWSRHDFDRWLAQPHVTGHVLDRGGGVAGFFLLAAEADFLHVINLAVARAWRRRGIGTHALTAIDELARERGLARIDLEVRETNLGAQLLYRKAGYAAVSILRHYYGSEDGYLMRRQLGARAPSAAHSSRPA